MDVQIMHEHWENAWVKRGKKYRLNTLKALGELYGRNSTSPCEDNIDPSNCITEERSLAYDEISKPRSDL